jgi:hypothetical protein
MRLLAAVCIKKSCIEKGKIRTYMAESIPLSSALRVHDIQIIIADSTSQGLDLMLEDFTSKPDSTSQGLDLMLEDFTSKRRSLGYVGREAISTLALFQRRRDGETYSNRTISPVLISAAAAFTLAGVRRFNRPI